MSVVAPHDIEMVIGDPPVCSWTPRSLRHPKHNLRPRQHHRRRRPRPSTPSRPLSLSTRKRPHSHFRPHQDTRTRIHNHKRTLAMAWQCRMPTPTGTLLPWPRRMAIRIHMRTDTGMPTRTRPTTGRRRVRRGHLCMVSQTKYVQRTIFAMTARMRLRYPENFKGGQLTLFLSDRQVARRNPQHRPVRTHKSTQNGFCVPCFSPLVPVCSCIYCYLTVRPCSTLSSHLAQM
jgi:hypothetical protein